MFFQSGCFLYWRTYLGILRVAGKGTGFSDGSLCATEPSSIKLIQLSIISLKWPLLISVLAESISEVADKPPCRIIVQSTSNTPEGRCAC